ncbi:MAG TPA: glycosyltransferase family 39 protein [Acidimicrobiales bacterium]|nr:glycosyltransferase family 39 protein [Acidimicrobiales bacterium]
MTRVQSGGPAAVIFSRRGGSREPANVRRRDSRAIQAVAALTLISLALGLIGLSADRLSGDEAATVVFASVPRFAGLTEDGGNMTAYYLLIHVIIHLFGASRVALRLPSVIAGAATVPLVAALGHRIRGARVGLVAAALFTISLPLVTWQQVARGYTPGMFLATASVLAWLLLLERPDFTRAVGYVFLTTLAGYTLLFCWWLVVAEAVAMLIAERLRRRVTPTSPVLHAGGAAQRRVLAAMGTALVCGLPLAAIATRKGFVQLSWLRRPSIGDLGGAFVMLASGLNGARGTILAVGVVLAVGTGVCWLASLGGVRDARADAPQRIEVLLCAFWMILPPLGAFVGSWVSHPVYQDRYFEMCLPAAAVLTAVGLDRMRRLGTRFALVAVTTLVLLHAVVLAHGYPP